MKITSKQEGFTLAELLIAVAIIALGFLAIAEMQYLSLRQKQKSELGSIATNMVQFVADRDMEEVRRMHLLNTIAHSATVAGRMPDFSYCDGSEPTPCTDCPGQPCDTMRVLTVDDPGDPPWEEPSCAPMQTHNFDPEKLVFDTPENNCTDPDADMYIIKNVRASQVKDDVTGVDILTVTLTYAVKTPGQFAETGLTIVDPANNNLPILRNSVATQTHMISAHIDNWSQIIPGWSEVRVPHIP